MELAKIKNLIFDLGGVIIDLHINLTVKAFCELASVDPEEIIRNYGTEKFFKIYECGEISDDEFRMRVANYLGIEMNSEEIDKAWNAMLGEIPAKRINRLEELSKNYNVFLLSNTNSIHFDAYTKILQDSTGHLSLNHLFKKAYYSHELKMRKPDEEIFVHVLEDSNLLADESLFLDDTAENLRGAERLGINTFHVEYPDQWLSIL